MSIPLYESITSAWPQVKSNSDFGVGFDAVDDDMLSEVTGVSPGSTLEGNILVAVPQDTTTLTVAYQETYEDGSDADAYFVDLSL